MGTTIGLIVLSVGFILVTFCNCMVNYYQTRFQEKLHKRVTELEWQNKELKVKTELLEKFYYKDLEIIYNKDIYETGNREDQLIFGLKAKENK